MPIYDVTLPISEDLIVWPGDPSIRLTQVSGMEEGADANVTRMEMSVHTGTHLDAPRHFLKEGAGVETLDLNVLVGPALVVEVMGAPEITAVHLNALSIPPGTVRLLLHTDNSHRWAAGETEFYEEYVALSADGAEWLVDHGVKLVGVDYLSVAPFDAPVPTHRILLEAGVIPVEGLNLHDVPAGLYQLHCLPMKIAGSDGAPVRAILID